MAEIFDFSKKRAIKVCATKKIIKDIMTDKGRYTLSRFGKIAKRF